MKAFVTGGSGFIGQYLVKKLIARGDTVHALARSEESASFLRQLGATVFMGDITDAASLRPAMEGCDVVFHVAAWYKVGAPDWSQAEAINVGGTRRVLRLAYELGIPKIVYTSTVAVFGDTQGQLVDETYYKEGPFLTEYDRTKWLAHYKVALPLIEKGAPIVIVMPGAVYGPGDSSFVAQMMRMFYRGLPLLPGSDLTVTYAHVDDIAEGHLLAAEQGTLGESYILTGPAIPLNEMVDFWAHLIGRKPPSFRLAGRPLRKFAPVVGAVGSVLPLPELFSEEAVGSLGATYMARSDKARTELGWKTRPLQTGLLETFDWIARTEPQQTAPPERKWAGYALLAAAVLFLLWFLGRKRE
ncbi:NAD-dependent epimerase/dehydratase family protein [Candidatus Leptofilum sp.]|uniref:NAD-dependent epimerase/dehydratase family protein n=1 Tax=Candidatus Leptofilum sp. TaxID=3241576 RepID=UPI003B59BA9F